MFEMDVIMYFVLDFLVFKEKFNWMFVFCLDCGIGSYKGDGSNFKFFYIFYNFIYFLECIFNLLGSRVFLFC